MRRLGIRVTGGTKPRVVSCDIHPTGQAGQEMLARRPEADRPGFVPCAEDQRRETKYAERRRIEQHNRDAIRRGDKVYDATPGERSARLETPNVEPGSP